jgi:fibronectin-binding autotransporter adhesin
MPLSGMRVINPTRMRAAAVFLLSVLAALEARADCAAGDGTISAPGVCTTPQNLTGPTGTIARGATLSTGANGAAYTVSSSNSTVTNSGAVTSLGSAAFLIKGPAISTTPPSTLAATLINNSSVIASQGTAIVVTGNPGTSLKLVNTGNIVGGAGTAVNYVPFSGGTIAQSGGTIDGTISLSGLQTVLNVTGGAINGFIVDQTPASGSPGSSQNRGGLINFDLGAGSFTTNGNITVGAVNVQSGTLALSNDVYVSGGFTNNARLQINGVRTLTGSFVQNSSGTLVMQVSPEASSQLKVARLPFFGGGTASLAGTLVLAYAPGIYRPRNYTLLSAPANEHDANANGVTGAFSTVSGSVPTAGLAQSVLVNTQSVDLVLSPISSATVVAPTNDTVFSAVTTTAILNGQWTNRMLLDRWGSAHSGIADGPLAAGLAVPAKLQTASAGAPAPMDALAAALPEAMTRYGGWFWGTGNFASLNGSATAPGFTARSGGFLAGIDQPVGDQTWLGAAAGYSHTGLSEHSTSSGDMDTGRVAFYGGTRLGPAVLSATTGFAYDRITTARPLVGIGTAQEGHDGQEFTVAAQASLPLEISGVRVTPRAGVQFLNLFESDFAETGANGFNLSNRGRNTDSFQPYVAVSSWRSFVTDEGIAITPEVRLGYSREALSNSRQLTVATVNATDFPVQGVKPSKNMLTAGVGLTLRAQDNVYLYANYDAVVPTGNTTYQIVSAGLRIKF